MDVAARVIAQFGSQSALARALGINQSTVQHWAKNGQIPSWRREQILKAARELGIPLDPSELTNAPGSGRAADTGRAWVAGSTAMPQAGGRVLPRRAAPASVFVAYTESGTSPGPGAAGALPHGRADWIPDQEQEIGALREELREVRDVLERLVEEVALLRRERSASTPDDESKTNRSSSEEL
jgi:DNA-binding transcriptional MerR regulator